MDLLHFNGEHVEDWSFKLEEYFDVAETPLVNRVNVASFHMVGVVYAWYKWMAHNEYTNDWIEFSKVAQWQSLKELEQTGSFAKYQSWFKELSTKVHGLFEN